MRAESVDGVEEVVTQWARVLHVEQNMQARIEKWQESTVAPQNDNSVTRFFPRCFLIV